MNLEGRASLLELQMGARRRPGEQGPVGKASETRVGGDERTQSTKGTSAVETSRPPGARLLTAYFNASEASCREKHGKT